MISTFELICLIIIGLLAGGLGGLLGIGGSIVIIPVLIIGFGHSQHLAQAAAMIVNIFVAIPAVIQHQRAKAVRWDAVWKMLPFGVVLILIGVELSNQINGAYLQRIFGAFLLYVIYMNVMKLMSNKGEPQTHEQLVRWHTCGFVGSATGFAAGLLGIGGGIITVPLLQRACRLPLRQCIASSAAIMCLTAIIGAARKNWGLSSIPGDDTLTFANSAIIAGCFIPTAIIGGMMGAKLTHTLPLKWVRIAFIILLCWGSWKMLDLPTLFRESSRLALFENPEGF